MNVYDIKSMAERLSGNTYPGRGIVLGVTPDRQDRRGRLFHHGPQRQLPQPRLRSGAADGIRTEAFDPSLRWRTPS